MAWREYTVTLSDSCYLRLERKRYRQKAGQRQLGISGICGFIPGMVLVLEAVSIRQPSNMSHQYEGIREVILWGL